MAADCSLSTGWSSRDTLITEPSARLTTWTVELISNRTFFSTKVASSAVTFDRPWEMTFYNYTQKYTSTSRETDERERRTDTKTDKQTEKDRQTSVHIDHHKPQTQLGILQRF